MSVKIKLPEIFFDDVVWNPMQERVNELCSYVSSGDLSSEEAAEKIVEEFQKYLIKHKIE